MREIMESVADEGVNEISAMCSAQSAKTLTLLCLVAWIIAEDPGPILWVTSSVAEAKKLAKSRLLPLLERCAQVSAKMPKDRTRKTTCEIYFPGCPLIIAGAESPAARQSTPFRYVIMDEARQYPAGAIEQLSKRFRSYTHNYKKIIISTPEKEGDAVHQAFLSGDQRRFHVPCPKCGHEHPVAWGDKKTKGGLKWEKDKDTFDEERGSYRFDALAKTVQYRCWNPECDKIWRDVPEDRKYLSSNGRWIPGNTNAPSNVRSYTWNALLPWWPSWKDQVREFLLAKKALEWTDFAPLKDHINETRGEVWTDKLKYADSDGYLEGRKAKYDPKEPWEAEKLRFMTVDVQGAGGRHFYYVIRAWGLRGRSRLLTYGKAFSWEELKEIQREWQVKGSNVVIDSGAWATEVYKQVVLSGYEWKAFKGDDKECFRHDGQAWLHSKTSADPAIGTASQGRVRTIALYMWAKYGVRERLYAMLHGTIGDWQALDDYSEDYALQVTTWDRRSRTDRHGTEVLEWYQKHPADHYCDCEQMQVVAASITGLLTMPGELELFEGQAAAERPLPPQEPQAPFEDRHIEGDPYADI